MHLQSKTVPLTANSARPEVDHKGRLTQNRSAHSPSGYFFFFFFFFLSPWGFNTCRLLVTEKTFGTWLA